LPYCVPSDLHSFLSKSPKLLASLGTQEAEKTNSTNGSGTKQHASWGPNPSPASRI
jgi:hypothetical protein